MSKTDRYNLAVGSDLGIFSKKIDIYISIRRTGN